MRSCLGPLAMLMLFAALFGSATNRDAQSQGDSVRLSRYGDLLTENHIELNKSSLVRALTNSNPEVRYFAAMKLAEDKVIDVAPEVKHALAIEKVPRTRVNLAIALGLLGDPQGRNELNTLCADQNFPLESRLFAVRYMFDLHVDNDENCLHAAEQIAGIVNSDYHTAGYRITALELLTHFHNLRTEDFEHIFQIVAERLSDPEPTVRMQASQSLIEVGDPAKAALYLRAAMANEKDEAVRSMIEKNLKKVGAAQ
jgi:HEAT repeat protein